MADVAKALLPAFGTLVLILLVGLCMQLLHEGLDVVRLRSLLLPLLAHSVPLVLPSAFLTAVVMTFGRLSADNELLAVRAAGIHLANVIWPVLLAGAALTVVAALFQFEMAPRSQAAIERLKLSALRQVVLDRVQLSAQRRFRFQGSFIQYDDIVDGKLTNLMLLTMGGRHPQTVITAATAMVEAAADQPDVLAFIMDDCVITQFGTQAYGTPVSGTAKRAICYFSLGQTEQPDPDDEKLLPTVPLMRRIARLHQRVAAEPRIPDPERERRQWRERLRMKVYEVSEVNRTLDNLQQRHQKYAVQERHQSEATVQSCQERIADARQQLSSLQPQLLACLRSVREAREDAAHLDYERLVELERQRKLLQGQVDARNRDIEELNQEILRAQGSMSETDRRASQVMRQIEVLQIRVDSLREEQRGLFERLRSAQDQCELRSAWMRVHKRLAQAVSLLAFAFVGIPLGVMAGPRSVMMAFGISFAIVLLVFYPFLLLGQVSASAGNLPMVPAVWAGNAFVFVIGLVLMRRILAH